MTESRAWLVQVRSDVAAADRVLDREDPSSFCQCLAKSQQIVEKSIKASVAALIDCGVIAANTRPKDRGHLLDRHIAVLSRLPRAAADIGSHAYALVGDVQRQEIEALSRLAPRLPEPGGTYQRNTEYPFNTREGEWSAPAEATSFSLSDVDRFFSFAKNISIKATRLLTAVEKLPASR